MVEVSLILMHGQGLSGQDYNDLREPYVASTLIEDCERITTCAVGFSSQRRYQNGLFPPVFRGTIELMKTEEAMIFEVLRKGSHTP